MSSTIGWDGGMEADELAWMNQLVSALNPKQTSSFASLSEGLPSGSRDLLANGA
jgi:hypothetical protein